MKNRFNCIFAYLIAVLLASISCKKEEIKVYAPEQAAIEFERKAGEYSFRVSGKLRDTIEIPFRVEGYAVDYERKVDFIVVADSTTATDKEYKILGAVVEPGKDEGVLRLEVRNDVGDDFKNVRIYFQVNANDDFKKGVYELQFYTLGITNEFIRPSGWTAWLERYYLGNYSTAYYKFIVEATGETNFPWPRPIPGYNNGKAWSNGGKNAFLALLKDKLKERNKKAGTPLLHDDGLAKGKEVVVGKYYSM